MKLVRLKINDPKGFRSLQAGFEINFRTEWDLEDEAAAKRGQEFAPFVLAGPNGSGKSNVLEALAAIFYQLDVLRVGRDFLPENHPSYGREASQATRVTPKAYELEYLMPVRGDDSINAPRNIEPERPVHVHIEKKVDDSAVIHWSPVYQDPFDWEIAEEAASTDREWLLPEFILGYSSGENELLSLPFFKMRFIQFDEYLYKLVTDKDYSGKPDSRLVLVDPSITQALMITHFLMQDTEMLCGLFDVTGLEKLRSFRVILKRQVELTDRSTLKNWQEGESNGEVAQAAKVTFFNRELPDGEVETYSARLKLTELLERKDYFVDRLRRCATMSFETPQSGDLYMDFFVDDTLRQVFKTQFGTALELFQGFRVLVLLNLYSVGHDLKGELYGSNSDYITETVPTLAANQKLMRFEEVRFKKKDIGTPITLRSLSDGEHQLLHSFGLALLFRNTRSLFLLDEPETHLNPQWRAKFISSLRRAMQSAPESPEAATILPEMLITTHSPFLISDSKKDKVLIFNKIDQLTAVRKPDFQTFGASISEISVDVFNKEETIGELSNSELIDAYNSLRYLSDNSARRKALFGEFGDSPEKYILLHYLKQGAHPDDI